MIRERMIVMMSSNIPEKYSDGKLVYRVSKKSCFLRA